MLSSDDEKRLRAAFIDAVLMSRSYESVEAIADMMIGRLRERQVVLVAPPKPPNLPNHLDRQAGRRGDATEMKSQIGNAALQTILAHERACFNDMLERHYLRDASGIGHYVWVKDIYPDLANDVVERWKESAAFARWATEQFKRQNGVQTVEEMDAISRGLGEQP